TRARRREAQELQGEYEAQLARLMARRAQERTERAERDVDAAKQRYVRHVQLLSLDYNALVTEQRAELLESQLSLMYAQFAHHHQAYTALRDFEPAMRRLGEHVAELRRCARADAEEARELVVEPRASVDGAGYMQVGQQDSDAGVESLEPHEPRTHRRGARRSLASISLSPHGLFQMSGYMFLRSQYAIMASWQRRWFAIRDGALEHCTPDSRDCESIPLHLCMVRRGAQAEPRRNVFELVAPNRTYVLQAESSNELSAWKACLRQAIETSLYADDGGRAASEPVGARMPGAAVGEAGTQMADMAIGASASYQMAGAAQAQRLARMQRVRGNDACADCGRAGPEWAAINLGALVCIECSGAHRSLGVHVSKVRSVKLDNWEPELAQIMLRLGNARVARVYEQCVPPGARPPAGCSREERQPFQTRKYAAREF
ncbi:hypothetical protein GGF43_006485, partial [Coemansia sp. RSA 2618]